MSTDEPAEFSEVLTVVKVCEMLQESSLILKFLGELDSPPSTLYMYIVHGTLSHFTQNQFGFLQNFVTRIDPWTLIPHK